MNVNSQTISLQHKLKTFNNPERFIEGWYWVMPSQDLQVGKVKPITILGRKLVVYRGKDRRTVIFDAYCPHMGAHLAEGKVEGNELRCFFHHWKFDSEGICVEIPCLEEPIPIKLKTWPTAEKYGIIWIWTGEIPTQSIPFALDLAQKECDFTFSHSLVTNCHPNVVMINGIDSQHFNTVHKLISKLIFEKQELHENAIIFSSNICSSKDAFFVKLLRLFHKNSVTYSVCYWYGSTGIMTLSSGFFCTHFMFTMRLLEGGKAEAQSLAIMRKRQGIFGWLYNRVVLWITKTLIIQFIQDDTRIFQKIQFNLKTPIKADQSIMQFINHIERQKALTWGTWNLARSRDGEIRENREKWRNTMSND